MDGAKIELINYIENQTYEKTLLGQTNFDATLPAILRIKQGLWLKMNTHLTFLELGDEFQ